VRGSGEVAQAYRPTDERRHARRRMLDLV
jgi:hypothetical protein